MPDAADERPLLLVRADAGPAVGAGHVVRCAAIAAAWVSRGGQVALVAVDPPVPVPSWPGAVLPVAVGDGAAVRAVTEARGAVAVVLDRYGLGPDDVAALAGVVPVLQLLDGPAPGPLPDVVVNQNLAASAELYPQAGPDVRLLLGAPYVLLRESIATRVPHRYRTDVERVVVVFGGSDPRRLGPPVAAALAGRLGADVTLVHGPLAGPIGEVGGATVLHDPDDMGEVLAGADLLVTAAGGTCWEAARLGVPMVAVEVADNQRSVVEGLRAADLADVADADVDAIVAATVALAAAADRRAEVAARGPRLIDGRGASRVVEVLWDLSASRRR